MGLGSFLRNVVSRVVPTLSRVVPKVVEYGRRGAGFLMKLPGYINNASDVLHNGFEGARRIINTLPDSKFKTKLTEITNAGEGYLNHYEPKARRIGETLGLIGSRGETLLNRFNDSQGGGPQLTKTPMVTKPPPAQPRSYLMDGIDPQAARLAASKLLTGRLAAPPAPKPII